MTQQRAPLTASCPKCGRPRLFGWPCGHCGDKADLPIMRSKSLIITLAIMMSIYCAVAWWLS